MKQFKRVCSLALALALVMSLAAVGASAASEPYYLTHDEAIEYISLQINTDLEDDTVYIDSEDALEYYDPYWEQTRLNTGYHALERDTSITVTHLPGNPAGDSAYIYIVLVPYSQQADGSYVSALEENTFYEMWADGDPYTDTDYIYYCTDGNFHPLSEFADNSEGAMQYGYGFADYQSASLAPGDSATFTIPFDRFSDDLMYEVQAIMNYPDGPDSTYNSFRISRVKLDEAAVAQMRAEQAGQTETVAGFTDVPASAWYASYVQTVVDKDLFAGVGEGTFAPESSMTYAQFLTVLYKFSGDQLPASQGAWYQGYVDWAENAGLVPAEIADFNPDAAITRQDMAALFGNFLNAYEHPGQSSTSQEPAFHDAGSIAGYAADGVTLCYQMGLMSGKDGNLFDPLATATRAEVAVTMTQMARVMGR